MQSEAEVYAQEIQMLHVSGDSWQAWVKQRFSQKMQRLLIIPCCARKRPDGQKVAANRDRLVGLVSPSSHENLLSARVDVLAGIRSEQKYLSGKCAKNAHIQDGPDFGATSPNGLYMPALERYIGSLYTGNQKLADVIRANEPSNSKTRVLILSALYGPLHPLDLIQDYNLQMSDKPAYRVWKDQFSIFLENYVDRNHITDISLYVGSSTRYFRVAELAAKRLRQRDLIDSVIQYEVINGSSYITPFTHGRLLFSHLTGDIDSNLESGVVPRQI